MKNLAYFILTLLFVVTTSCKEDEIVYNTAARADFNVGETFEVGEPITFSDATIPNVGTQITSYLWEFGDAAQSTSNEQNPTFTYKEDGIFQIKLTVTDSNELRASSLKEIKVVNPTTPDFYVDKKEYQMGEEIQFTDATYTKSGTTVVGYLWEFQDSDKSTSTDANPTFAYQEAGSYPVKLTVTDSYGLKSSVVKNVNVFDPSMAVSVQWTAAIGGAVKGGSSAAMSPDGSTVYMLSSMDGSDVAALKAYDAENGSLKWLFDISIAMQDASPTAIAKDIFSSPSVSNDGSINIIVRDLQSTGDNRSLFVISVNPDGTKKWHYSGGGNVNLYAVTPAIDASGNVYVGHRGGKLWKLSSDGSCTELTSEGLFDMTTGFSISRDGMLYGAGKGNLGLFAYNVHSDATQWVYNTDFGGASSAFTGALRSAPASIGTDGTVYYVTDQTSGGAILALNADGSVKWKYQTTGEIPDGGVVLGADGTVYANGGCKPSAGVFAFNPNGTLKWHYPTSEDTQTSPILDNRGYIHFVTADATYHVLTADGSLYSSLKIGDSTISTPVMDANGNLYVAVQKDGIPTMVCATSKAESYAMDSPWPMRGQNPQRTSLQK